jgi:hypothetical protein
LPLGPKIRIRLFGDVPKAAPSYSSIFSAEAALATTIRLKPSLKLQGAENMISSSESYDLR